MAIDIDEDYTLENWVDTTMTEFLANEHVRKFFIDYINTEVNNAKRLSGAYDTVEPDINTQLKDTFGEEDKRR